MPRSYQVLNGNQQLNGAFRAMVALNFPAILQSMSYEAGDFIVEGGILYRCNADHTTGPGSSIFDVDTAPNWDAVTMPVPGVNDAGKFFSADNGGSWKVATNPVPVLTDNGDGSYTHDDGLGVLTTIAPAVESVTVTFTTAQWTADGPDFVLDITDAVHGLANGVGAVTVWEAGEVIGAQVQIIGTTLQLRVVSAFTGEVTLVSRSPNIVALP